MEDSNHLESIRARSHYRSHSDYSLARMSQTQVRINSFNAQLEAREQESPRQQFKSRLSSHSLLDLPMQPIVSRLEPKLVPRKNKENTNINMPYSHQLKIATSQTSQQQVYNYQRQTEQIGIKLEECEQLLEYYKDQAEQQRKLYTQLFTDFELFKHTAETEKLNNSQHLVIERLQYQIREHDQRLKQVREESFEEVSKLQEFQERLLHQLGEKDNQLNTQQLQLDAAATHQQQLEQRISELEFHCKQEAQQAAYTYGKQVEACESRYQTMLDQLKLTQVESFDEMETEMKVANKVFQMELARLHSIIQSSKHDYLVKNRQLEATIIELNLQLSKADSSNRELHSTIQVLTFDKANQKEKIDLLDREIIKQRSELEWMQSSDGQMKTEVQNYSRQMEALFKTNRSLNKKLRQLEHQMYGRTISCKLFK